MSIVASVLMCHAPIVIPRIAGPRGADCVRSTRAMAEAAELLVAHEPELLIVLSPHTPRRAGSLALIGASEVRGSFARFGHPELDYTFTGAPAFARTLADVCAKHGIHTHALSGDTLDHGALVPLHFVAEAGYRGEVLVVGLCMPDAAAERAFGEALRDAVDAAGLRVALLASGDMSHRLTPDAPAGFDARAREFDARFVAALEAKDLAAAIRVDEALQELAAEDVIASCRIAHAALGSLAREPRVLAYEGPFGVGYCEAVLYATRARKRALHPALAVARDAVAHAVRGERYTPPELGAPWRQARAVFVTLRAPDGELRGCIGRTEPHHATLAGEIADCATSAATRDTRMVPVGEDELGTLDIELSLLAPPEAIASAHDLDPARYGVVVTHGARRGVLLPAIDGIRTVTEQLRIALRKAGIPEDAPYTLERFTVDKIDRHTPAD